MDPENEARAVALRTLPLIDLTSLGDDDQPSTIEALCRAATTANGNVAAVCVWPRFVAQAVAQLSGTGVPVAAVANFPDGGADPARAVAEARAIVDAGGVEVDVVVPWRAYLGEGEGEGDADTRRLVLQRTRSAIGADIALKAILETGEIGDPTAIRTAADEALHDGADFLKTSTGKTAHSASPEAARVLLEAVAADGGDAGVKVSGGVRTVAQAAAYLAIADEVMGRDWVGPANFRFGASGLLDDVIAAIG